MSDLSAFPITKRWPAQHPDRLQLYSLPTPNGVKVSIMLEEIGLPYEVHLVDFGKDDQLWVPGLLDAVADAAPLLATGQPEPFMTRIALLTGETRTKGTA